MTEARPDGIGALLHAMLAPPTQDGPPYVHTFQHPEPVPVLDDDGQPVLDEDGEPVTQVPLLPTHTITIGDGAPVQVEGLRLEYDLGERGRLPVADLTMGEFSMSFKATPEWTAFFANASLALEPHDERWFTQTRRYWSGPDKFDRKILRAYRVKAAHIGLAPRSVLDDRYRRKQRARRRRR
jgi:hypothetical protein